MMLATVNVCLDTKKNESLEKGSHCVSYFAESGIV